MSEMKGDRKTNDENEGIFVGRVKLGIVKMKNGKSVLETKKPGANETAEIAISDFIIELLQAASKV